MSVIKTTLIGEPVLRETAESVIDVTDVRIQQTIADLIDTMREEQLIGMAAPQIGDPVRIFVSEIRETQFRKTGFDTLRIYINPEIMSFSRETELDYEGCGSIPGLFGKVERSVEIFLKYQDEEGVPREMTASGLLARVIQHEIDHLNGVLFTDLADPKSLVSKDYYIKHIIGKE